MTEQQKQLLYSSLPIALNYCYSTPPLQRDMDLLSDVVEHWVSSSLIEDNEFYATMTEQLQNYFYNSLTIWEQWEDLWIAFDNNDDDDVIGTVALLKEIKDFKTKHLCIE